MGYGKVSCAFISFTERFSASDKRNYRTVFAVKILSVPSSLFQPSKMEPIVIRLWAPFGGEMGIRTPGTAVAVHMISNHAPSASSDISPYDFLTLDYYIRFAQKNQ